MDIFARPGCKWVGGSGGGRLVFLFATLNKFTSKSLRHSLSFPVLQPHFASTFIDRATNL